MRSLARHPLRLDRDLVANILDIAVQEVSHLLNGRGERETISEFGQINRRPGPFAPSAHGPPPRCPKQRTGCECSAVFLRRPIKPRAERKKVTTTSLHGAAATPHLARSDLRSPARAGIVISPAHPPFCSDVCNFVSWCTTWDHASTPRRAPTIASECHYQTDHFLA